MRARLSSRSDVMKIAFSAVLIFVLPSAVLAQSIVGILGIAREVAPLEKRLQNTREVTVRGYVFRVGTLDGHQVVVGRSGTGKVNAAIITTLLINQFNPSVIFFSGTAGAIDQSLYPGDVVIGASVAQHDYGVQAEGGLTRQGQRNVVTGERDPVIVQAPEELLTVARQAASGVTLPRMKTVDGDRLPRIVEGVIVTGDVFLSDPSRREELRKSLGAMAIEMEGAAVVQTCRQFRVSCLVVRSVTDRADAQAQGSYDQFIGTASENAAAVVARIISGL